MQKPNKDDRSNNVERLEQMVENTQENRKIIMRFLGANQIQNVVIDNRTYTLMDFYNNYLQ